MEEFKQELIGLILEQTDVDEKSLARWRAKLETLPYYELSLMHIMACRANIAGYRKGLERGAEMTKM